MSRSRAPIEGRQPPPLPSRPRCPGCGNALRPQLFLARSANPRWNGQGERPRQFRVWAGATADSDGRYNSYGHFCTLTCATGFANRIVNIVQAMRDKRLPERAVLADMLNACERARRTA